MVNRETRVSAVCRDHGLVLFVSLVWLGIAAGCSDNTATAPARTSEAPGSPMVVIRPPTAVSLQLNWFPEAEHGGFFAAEEHGLFDEAGLDVEIRPGGPGTQVVAQVATGRVQFGVTNADRVLVGQVAGAKTVTVMAAMQVSPRCVLVHENSGIESLKNLGRVGTLAISSTATWSLFLQKQVDLDGVQLVPYAGNVSQFLLQDDFAQQGYSISEPFVARAKGSRPRVLMVSELGFNPYTSVLITRPELIRTSPDLVRRMVVASVRGWQKYLDDPQRGNQAIHQRNEEMGLPILAYGARELRRLCVTDEVPRERLGRMTVERWRQLAAQLVETGAIEADKLEIGQVFTNRFLPAKSSAGDADEG